VVQDISGIEKIICLLTEKKSIKEEQLRAVLYSTSDQAVDQKLMFLRSLGCIKVVYDMISLSDNLQKYATDAIKRVNNMDGKDNIRDRHLNLYIRFYILRSLATVSFSVDEEQKYTFKKQAAILLIYAFMAEKIKTNKYLRVTPTVVTDIKAFFKKLDYKPLDRNKRELEFNQNKLSNALKILVHLGLAEKVKIGRNTAFYPKFDPYLLLFYLNKMIRDSKTSDKAGQEINGISIASLLKQIAENLVPFIQDDTSAVALFISNAIGGALWILYSRQRIKMLDKGDEIMIDRKPSFLIAKLGSKINWIEKV